MHLSQWIVCQTAHNHHRQSVFTDVKNDAAIMVTQLYAGKPKLLARME